jgi:hypothetical protein
MISAGILDPAKVTRSALQNAASIAGLMLTTEALVSEIPEAEKAAIRPVVANHRCTNRTVKLRRCELEAGLHTGIPCLGYSAALLGIRRPSVPTDLIIYQGETAY